MKRFIMLALVAAFVLGGLSFAGATELKVKGEFQVHGEWSDNINFKDKDRDNTNEDDFRVMQRMRSYFSYVASENLKAVWGLEVGTTYWGNAGGKSTGPGFVNNVGQSSGGGLDTDGVNVETKWAYLDFTVPGTEVKVTAGLQPLALPSAFNGTSPVLDIDGGAIVVSTPFNDMVSLTAGWGRAVDNNIGAIGDGTDRSNDEIDLIFAVLPITPTKGLSITPWGAYAIIGRDTVDATGPVAGTTVNVGGPFGTSGGGYAGLIGPASSSSDSTANAWWAGVAAEVANFEPFAVYADVLYGQLKDAGLDRAGWMADLMIQYKGLSFGTPTLFGMYSTGEDDNGQDGKSERMPYIQQFWAYPGSFFFSGTSFDTNNADIGGNFISPVQGTWVVGAGMYGMSFLDKLSHDLVVAYIQGTNDKDSAALLNTTAGGDAVGLFLTEKDHIWEVNFNHSYQIYEQLAAIAEIGYMHADYDSDVWGNGADDLKDAWRFLLGFKYKF